MSGHILWPVDVRIYDIEKEIKGVKSLYNITQFEMDVMASIKRQNYRFTPKQFAVIGNIESKVFGRNRVTETTTFMAVTEYRNKMKEAA